MLLLTTAAQYGIFKRTVKSFIRNYSTKEKKIITAAQQQSNNDKQKTKAPEIPSFMPVINIPVTELAHNAFYSLHRPLLGLSIPEPFLVGNMVGKLDKEPTTTSEEDIAEYMSTLRPFEPPEINLLNESLNNKDNTTTITVEVDPSYFLNHNNNHDEITDYLTAMQEKLNLLYEEKEKRASMLSSKKKFKRLRKRKGFFEKN